MSLEIFFDISLVLFLIGLIYKVFTWFYRPIGIWSKDHSASGRFAATLRGIVGAVFSPRLLTLIKAMVLDVLLQRRILQTSLLRWVMHMLIFWGFLGLLLMHALGESIIPPLFGEYYSTRNPYFFLRDLFGAMVLIGLAIAVIRRYVLKVPRLKTNGGDLYAIVVLAIIMLSGILLTGFKITSHSEFERMVFDYAGMDDETDIEALESLWVEEFGLVSPNVEGPFDSDLLEEAREIHEFNCADCHADTKWAFTGYTVAKAAQPAALALNRIGIINILWHLHILACFAGLVYLPFSKMFHIISTPLSLLADAVMPETDTGTAAVVTRQALELDACTHCGTCSYYCSAMMAYETSGNESVLPSEKMVHLKRLVKGHAVSRDGLKAIREGVYLCTNCDRCTVVCPSGIRLKELWVNVREDLIRKGDPEPLVLSPFSLLRGLRRSSQDADTYPEPLAAAQIAVAGDFDALTDADAVLFIGDRKTDAGVGDETFSHCFGCQTCTTVCPVVGCFEDPEDALGLLPHQLMCALGLGQWEMAAGARMIWDCVTCYQCQEHCPQKVQVTEILFALKNRAVNRVKEERNPVTIDETG